MAGVSFLLLGHADEADAKSPSWYRGNTHTHTINSDGNAAPDRVVRWYREHGYHFVFVTDHEYVTDVGPLNELIGARERFVVFAGQEITQWGDDPKRAAAHVNGLFSTTVIWPVGIRKCLGSGCGAHAPASTSLAETFRTNIAEIVSQGAIPQINHPNYRWAVRPEDLADTPDFTLLEIWNGQGRINNLGGEDEAGVTRPSAEGFWDILLSQGKIIWGVGADDSHDFGDAPDPDGAAPGQAWIMVRAPELTASAIRRSIERGDFYASTGVELEDIRADDASLALRIAESRPGAARFKTRFVGTGGRVLAEAAGTSPVYRFHGGENYVRAIVTDSNGNQAWTQPVFRDSRRERVSKRAD